jgi:PAS domain S-box-containing protein
METVQNSNKTLHILALEDSPRDFEIVRELLKDAGFDIRMYRVENEPDFISALSQNQYDLILADFNLPEYDVYSAIKEAVRQCPEVPLIVVSGSIGEVTAIELIKLGAVDYVLKDKPERLPFTIQRAMEEVKEKRALKKTEDALRLSEIRYRKLHESMRDGFVFVNMEGTIKDCNDSYQQMLGYTKDDLLKRSYTEITPEKWKDVESKIITEQIIPNGYSEVYEKEYIKKDGTIVPAELRTILVKNDKGENEGMWAIVRDITERKKSEEQLVIAKEKAEESDRLKSAFLHNISHEIRTPMNAIIGFSELLNDPNLIPAKRKSFSELIVQSSNQLLSIITDIVNISTIEAGQVKVTGRVTDLNNIMKQLYDQFLPKAQKQNISLNFMAPFTISDACITTDGPKLTTILSNLLSNAFKFTRQGTINFGYSQKENELEFFVEDTGIGISPIMHEGIFERFRQVEITASREYGGSGLGLPISKAYVELMGGKIWLHSEQGKGSQFFFTIPYFRVNKLLAQEKNSSTVIKKVPESIKTVLIAEDEDSNYLLLEEMLSGLDLNLIWAINGYEAVEICKINPDIDLVLMDIKMPIMDGIEATQRILKFRSSLPIMALSAFTTEPDQKKMYASGCIDFLSKPFSKDQILTKISQQIGIPFPQRNN